MPFTPALCPACQQPLAADFLQDGSLQPCPRCQENVHVSLYPAFFRAKKNASLAAKKEGEAACFYFPERPAVATCDICGVLVSDLCDLPFHDKHVCPRCFSRKENREKIGRQDASRLIFGGMALALAIIPLIFVLLTAAIPLIIVGWFIMVPFCAPAALFIALRYWKRPLAMGERYRFSSAIAAFLSLLQLVVWVVALIQIYAP